MSVEVSISLTPYEVESFQNWSEVVLPKFRRVFQPIKCFTKSPQHASLRIKLGRWKNKYVFTYPVSVQKGSANISTKYKPWFSYSKCQQKFQSHKGRSRSISVILISDNLLVTLNNKSTLNLKSFGTVNPNSWYGSFECIFRNSVSKYLFVDIKVLDTAHFFLHSGLYKFKWQLSLIPN